MITIVVIARCCAAGIHTIKILTGRPPFPRLSDGIYPLGCLAWLYWELAAERRDFISMFGLHVAVVLLGVPNEFLAHKPSRNARTCLYTYTPRAPCPPKLEFVCSFGESAKGIIGMIGARFVCFEAVALLVFTFQILTRRHKPRDNLVKVTFLIGLIFGLGSMSIGIYGTWKPTQVSILDCQIWGVGAGSSCIGCGLMQSPSSKNGYLEAWWSNAKNNWLSIIAMI